MLIKRFLAAGALSLFSVFADAGEIVIAQVSPKTGPLGPNGLANYLGAKVCLDQVNAEGGINGQTIRLLHEDDQYKPDETLRLVNLVAQRDHPVAFINLLGSANVAGLLKAGALDKLAIPVVGVTPGADALRNPGSRWMFHIHAGDHAQLRRIVTHLSTLGIQRVAVVYQDIPFGTSGMSYVEELAGQSKIQLVGKVAVKAGAEDLTEAAKAMRNASAQAYIIILAPNSGIAFVRDARAAGDLTSMYSLSYVPVKGLLDKVPVEMAAGIGIAQVTPNVYSNVAAVVRDFHAAMDKYAPPGTDHSQLHLVGYMAARVSVEALRRAGTAPTPDKMASALRQLRTNLGGYGVDFTGGNVASPYVDIGVVTGGGRLMY